MQLTTLARRVLLATMLGVVALVPAAARETGVTDGRSIATLVRVPLKTRNGARILLGSRIQPGKPTLISIWSSWCVPCVAEAPYLNKLRKQFAGRFNFIYINRREGEPDPYQPPEAVTGFLADAGMSDLDYVTADVAASRRILGADVGSVPAGKVGVPRVYLFDRSGKQIYGAYGFQESDAPDLERRVREAVSK